MPKVPADTARRVRPVKGFVRKLDGRAAVLTEHEEQREFVKWFRQEFRHIWIFAIPNGGSRSLATGARLKAEGVSAGIPDLFVPGLNLWIEMKRTKGGVVDGKQKRWHDYLRSIGHHVIIGYGAENAKTQVLAIIEMEKL
jgi:hypothetical protein